METVLICDHNVEEQGELVRLLSSNVCCEAVGTVAEALTCLSDENKSFAAVIVDLDATPDAEKLLATLAEEPAFASKSFLTASSNPAQESRSLEAGAQYFLHKPFVPAVVQAKLHAVLHSNKYFVMRKLAEDRDYDAVNGQFRLEHFHRIAEDIISASQDRDYTIVCMTINHFKMFNDFYGRETGNRILRESSTILRDYAHCLALSRSEQSVGFCILVDCTSEAFMADYPRLKDKLNGAFGTIPMEMTLGLCDYLFGCDTMETAYEKASFAHKYAAGISHMTYCIYNEKISERRKRKHFILTGFHDAIQNHEFVPYIQPKYNLYTDSFHGGEVLCRWIHGDDLISPAEFIPVLEENGLIPKLDFYMLSETLKIIKGWINHQVMPQPLSVNLSRISFYTNGLAEQVLALVDEIGVPHSLIQIEITESAYVELEDKVIEFVDKMLAAGIVILMDDFGSGYSSLNMLRNINVSYLKIDYRFLEKSRIQSRREQMLESVVKMARTIRVPLVVEGVETVEDATMLKSLGVQFVQGFLYARPMPLADFDMLPKSAAPEHLPAGFATKLLDDLNDIQSTARQLFESALSSMVICEYADGELYLVQLNPATQKSFLTDLNDLAHDRKNLLSFVVPQDRAHMVTYLNDTCRQATISDFVECDFATPILTAHLKLRMTLLAERGNGYTLLIDAMKLYDVESNAETSTLFELLDGVDRGYYIMGKNHEILYMNSRAKAILPHFVLGGKCTDFKRYDEDCTQCPLDNYNLPMSYYSQALGTFIENYVTEIRLNNEPVKLVRLDTSAGEVINTHDAMMRMNRAFGKDNEVYTEVNLETLRYNQITFAMHKTFDVPTEGDYVVNYEDMLERQIDQSTQRDVLRYFSAEGMQREYVEGKRVRARFRFAGSDEWGECEGLFLGADGVRYCCITTRNITAVVARETDTLTGILNADGICVAANDYLTEQFDRRAALYVLDLKNFKQVNDVRGHLFGDAVLKHLAKTLSSFDKEHRFVARTDGDEFALFAGDIADDAAQAALRDAVLRAARQSLAQDDAASLTDINLGLAAYPVDAQTYTELLAKAHARMYHT